MEMMAAHKYVIDSNSIEWCAKSILTIERNIDLETWCEANCQAHFSKQGFEFFFEDQNDHKLFEAVWN